MDHDILNQLFLDNVIDHATWCNASRYIDGNYHDHQLCRNAFLRCVALIHGEI